MQKRVSGFPCLHRPFRLACSLFGLFGLGATFQAAAQVEILGIVRTGNDIAIEFKGTAGTEYQVEKSATLAAASWAPEGEVFTASGRGQTVALAGAGVAGRGFFRIVLAQPVPAGFRLIREGSFLMGDQSTTSPQDGVPNERPVIEVTVPDFLMKATEVTRDEWDAVKTYGLANGYTFSSNAGISKAGNHPVHTMTWYDVVRWCNAKSEQDGLEPCYLLPDTLAVYKTGIPSSVTWVLTRKGYRLPSEAEWEKAARGGLAAQRFPWGATITHVLANYKSTTDRPYDASATTGFHPASLTPGTVPYTAPVGSFAANGYGLHDMSGNVRELCWDRISGDYSEGYAVDPTSATENFRRVVRGGDWSGEGYAARCSYRDARFPNTSDMKNNSIGFRLARNR